MRAAARQPGGLAEQRIPGGEVAPRQRLLQLAPQPAGPRAAGALLEGPRERGEPLGDLLLAAAAGRGGEQVGQPGQRGRITAVIDAGRDGA
ncbi:hypothetical protein [Candidatus Frankia alpina]|uniref:hypothetical protein n=1 Tax=Candidatus Frankia alpina TaxID=2699483 RepID=UPI001F222294|nr:hypothetical protein [Candidatus Frankia alpina]